MPKKISLELVEKLYRKTYLSKNKQINRLLRNIIGLYQKIQFSLKYSTSRKYNLISCYLKALDWIKKNSIPKQGIVITSNHRVSYLEVTGYMIPTLIEAGEHRLAEIYSDFLSKMQRPNGSLTGSDGKENIFDSAQVLRGFLDASQYWERFKPYALKTLNYIITSIEKSGLIPFTYEGGNVPKFIHIFILPVLAKAAEVLGNPEYLEISKKSLQFYKTAPNVIDINYLTHFLAYIIDGFIDMGELEFVRPTVKKIFSFQRKDGGIPAFPNVKWICSTGVAQFAIIGYKLGMKEEADRAINYLCKFQNPSGGFFGSYGVFAKYFPIDEISWANKFFIDAVHLKISSFFDQHASTFPKTISKKDGRLKSVLAHLGNLNNKKVLDAGCGKGRFAAEIKKLYPSCEVHGVDISEELLREVPDSIIKKKGSVLNLPYETAMFDGIFCIEVLEHAIRTKKVIEELCRVLKDDGRIIIIDKNIEKLGTMIITDFEQWFDKNKVKTYLEKYCNDVQAKEIPSETFKADGLFLAWTGIKSSNGK